MYKSNEITIQLYSCHDINMKFLVFVTPPYIYHNAFPDFYKYVYVVFNLLQSIWCYYFLWDQDYLQMDLLIYIYWCPQVEFLTSQQINCAPFVEILLLKNSFSRVVPEILMLASPAKLMSLPPVKILFWCILSFLGSSVTNYMSICNVFLSFYWGVSCSR